MLLAISSKYHIQRCFPTVADLFLSLKLVNMSNERTKFRKLNVWTLDKQIRHCYVGKAIIHLLANLVESKSVYEISHVKGGHAVKVSRL
jgi:hypothetical protein